MTRSSARRRNLNARMIAARFTTSDLNDPFIAEGSWSAESARRYVRPIVSHAVDTVDVNWPYLAELLNRKARRPLIFRNVRFEQPISGYGIYIVNDPQMADHANLVNVNLHKISRLIKGKDS